MRTEERDLRLNILNTLLTTPHRDIAKVHGVHTEMVQQDPIFYGHLASWYILGGGGDIRDHQECFVINLCISGFEGHRDEGLALLRQLPPYQLARCVDFIHGRKDSKAAPMPKTEKKARGKKVAAASASASGEKSDTAVVAAEKRPRVVVDYGLFRNVPTAMRTEVMRYLREREADDAWFDATALAARKQLKRLYSVLHIKPSERAQAILFDKDPPADSSIAHLRELSKVTDPAEQARVIIERRIPYRVASTVISQMTPTVLLALVEVMSAQELMNSLGSLKRRGALDNPDIKALVDKKLKTAKTSKRVSALKTTVAIEAAGLEGDTKAALEDIADTQLKAKGRITRPTGFIIDISGSMGVSLEVGKRVGSILSSIMDADLFAYAMNTMPYPIKAKGDTLADWEKATNGLRASGGTSYGCPLRAMRGGKQRVEQFLICGDGGDNTHPMFVEEYAAYCKDMEVSPNVVFVHVPGDTDVLSGQCKAANIPIDVWDFKGTDYYSLAGCVSLLSKPSKLDLLMTIMDFQIPKRRSA